MRYAAMVFLLMLAGCGEDEATPPRAEDVAATAAARAASMPAPGPVLDHITWHSDASTLLLSRDRTFEYHGDLALLAGVAPPRTDGGVTRRNLTGTWSPALPGPGVVMLTPGGAVRLVRQGEGRADFYTVPTVNRHGARFDPRWIDVSPEVSILAESVAMHVGEDHTTADLVDTESPTADPGVLEAIGKRTPEGWTCTAAGDAVLLAREKPVEELPGLDAEGHATNVRTRLVLVFRFRPLMTPAERAMIVESNAWIQPRLYELRMALQGVAHKGPIFQPKTDEERALVEEYRRSTAQEAPVPSHFSKAFSVYVTDSLSWGGAPLADATTDPPTVADKVKADVLSLFTPYDAAR